MLRGIEKRIITFLVMKNQIILVAMANSIAAPLDGLSKEYEAIEKALRQRHVAGEFQLLTEPATTPLRLLDLLHDLADRLAIFHFSGHANDVLIETIEGPSYAIGIAKLLSRSTSIRCVFLNGCSTRGQVEALLNAGVPVVIATSADVADEKAVAFSEHFYESMNNGSSLSAAFQAGESASNLLLGPIEIHRGVYKDFGKKNKDDRLWGIFCMKDESLNWSLAELQKPDPDYKPNENLIRTLAQTLAKPGNKLMEYEETRRNGGKVPLSLLMGEVLEACPFPIYEQLRLLLQPCGTSKDNFGVAGWDMLYQIAVNYSTAVRMITLVLLARLWAVVMLPEEGTEGAAELSPELKEKLRHFMFEANRDKFESLSLVQHIRKFLDEAKQPYFVDELSKLREEYKEGTAFFEACDYLEDLNHDFREWEADNSIRRNSVYFQLECQVAERHLAEFYKPLDFISRYEMRSFQNIDLSHSRIERKIKYRHYFINLAGGAYYGQASDLLDSHYDPLSVALVRDFKKREFLNLSPFILDNNIFSVRGKNDRKDEFKLMFFDNFNTTNNMIEFMCVYNPQDPKLQLARGKQDDYKPVFDQIDAFIQKISN